MPETLSATGLTTGHAPFVEEARSRGKLYISQAYELDSEENHEAWRQLFARIQSKWERYANPHFLRGVEALDLPHDRIPRLSEINPPLQPPTAFQAKTVTGTVPGFLFFHCLHTPQSPSPSPTHPSYTSLY